MKYIRLLRLPDQYIQFGAAVGSGLLLPTRHGWILWWAVATTLLSFVAFIINEMTDRHDTDRYSWNPIHADTPKRLDMRIVWLMIASSSLIGLVVSYGIGLLWWGIAMLVLGTAYSAKPIRLKARFGVDIAAQLLVWWVIPFVAPLWRSGLSGQHLSFILVFLGLIWLIFYPYQLADFTADRKAGLHATHTVLGMRNSLWLGLTLGTVGISGYILFAIYTYAIWSIAFVLLAFVSVASYFFWLTMTKIIDQEHSMQRYVAVIKPVTRLLVPYIAVWWWVIP